LVLAIPQKWTLPIRVLATLHKYLTGHEICIKQLDIIGLPWTHFLELQPIYQRREAMKLSKAAKIWIDHHKTHSKKNTVRSYRAVIERFIQEFGDGPVEQVTP
jgi:hypothetical protein